MKELWPNSKSDLVSFSATIQESLDKSDVNLNVPDNGLAEICEDGALACISKGCSLEIVNIKNGQRSSAFSFELQASHLQVSCFCSCQNKYLIGLKPRDEAQQSGILCLYDPGISRVVKCIKLDVVPTSICLIKEYGGAGDKSNFISDVFKCLFGMAAVGTSCGHVYIIDLRTDDKEECFTLPNPSSLLVTDASEVANISELRDEAKTLGKHCCVDLSYNFCSHNSFKYMDAEQRIMRLYHAGTFSVTALKYLHQAASLIVGYQFGCFHIFSMETLELTHSSQVGSLSIPVTNFTFQEPDDDPRSCCYLWVGRQPAPSDNTENNNVPTSLSLYQLIYEEKDNRPGYGNFYKNLECVIKRFNHQLTSDVHHLVDSHSAGSRIICLKTLAQNPIVSSSKTSEDLLSGSDSTLCYVVWETPSAEKDMTCHLGIFDINRWYQKQLPGSIRDAMYGRMEAVCPFFAFYSLSDIAEEFLPNGILDVWVNRNSISNFQSVVCPQSEHFYWPSSAMFSATCVSENSSINIEILGLQRQIIADARKAGTDSFVDAQEIVQKCWMAGLLQNTVDITRAIDDKRNADAVLSIYLEHDGINFITSCVKKWSHGSITHAGHSMKMIYDWAWNQVVHVKKSLDQLYVPMFQSVTEKLEPEHGDRLKRISIDIRQLTEVFRELQRADALSVADGCEELETREKIVSYLDTYCGILLLLVDVNLLPEQTFSSNNGNNVGQQPPDVSRVKYPYKVLSDYYAFQRNNHQTDQNKTEEKLCLFIDMMCKEFLKPKDTTITKEDFDMEENTRAMHQYPPKTMEMMCQLFVENYRDDGVQIMIFYYWILDICECFEQLQSNQVSKKFKDSLDLSLDKALLVESLWLLDHKLYKDAAEHLSLVESKMSSRYYTHIVRTLHKVGQLNLLVTFCSCKEPLDCSSFDELKFLVQVFLKMKLLDNAYRIQASYSNQGKKALLFNYFVEQCKENKLLGKLVSLALTSDEEELLKRILKRSNENQDYLLVYFLERGYYSDAYNLTREIRNSAKWRRLRSTLLTADEHFQDRKVMMMTFDQLETKGLLVDGFIQTVPSIEQKKLNLMEMKYSQNSSIRKADKKQPLSTMYRRRGDTTTLKDGLNQSLDILSTLYDHDLSTDLLDMSSLLECVGGNQRRRKSPLFDGELTSPKKKQKEMPSVAQASISTSTTTTEQPIKPTGKHRKDLFQGKDAFLLLATPPAIRRVKYVSIPNTGNPERLKTPQSILKSRGPSRILQTDPLKPLTLTSDTPSRKIRFIGLSPTSPLSPPNNNTFTKESPFKESPLKECPPLHLSYEEDKPSPIKESEEQILSTLDKDFVEARKIADSSQRRSLTAEDVNSILLELSRDEDGMDMNQSSVVTDGESYHSLSNTEDSVSNDAVSKNDDVSSVLNDDNDASSTSSSPVHTKPDVVQISSDDSSIKQDSVVQISSDNSFAVSPLVESQAIADATNKISTKENSLEIHSDTSSILSVDREIKTASVAIQDSDLARSPPPRSSRVRFHSDSAEQNKESDDDDDIVIVNETTATVQQQRPVEEFEKIDYVISDVDDYVEADEEEEGGDMGAAGKRAEEEVVNDYEMVQYEDAERIKDDEEYEKYRQNEQDKERDELIMHQEYILGTDDPGDVATIEDDNIEMSETTAMPVIPGGVQIDDRSTSAITTTNEESSTDTYQTIVSDDNEAIDAVVVKSPHQKQEVEEDEGIEYLREDQSLVVPVIPSSDDLPPNNKEDFEMIDIFSERDSNYGDRPKLFVDDSIPISSTFMENDSFSEDVVDDDVVPGRTNQESKTRLLEHLINVNAAANDSIVTESFGPNESMSTTINETLDTTTTSTSRRSRRSKTPTRLGLPSRRMVTRSATKKMMEESMTSNLLEESFNSGGGDEETMNDERNHSQSSTKPPDGDLPESLLQSTLDMEPTEREPVTKSLRSSTRKKITTAPRKSPSRRRATKVESLISLPLVHEEGIVEHEDGKVSSLTKVAERTNTAKVSPGDDQIALRTRRRSSGRVYTSREIGGDNNVVTATTRKTRTQRKEKEETDNKSDRSINDSVLSFDKHDASIESANHSLASTTTPTRTSKRSSSKRASLAIADLTINRKSLRSKNT